MPSILRRVIHDDLYTGDIFVFSALPLEENFFYARQKASFNILYSQVYFLSYMHFPVFF